MLPPSATGYGYGPRRNVLSMRESRSISNVRGGLNNPPRQCQKPYLVSDNMLLCTLFAIHFIRVSPDFRGLYLLIKNETKPDKPEPTVPADSQIARL